MTEPKANVPDWAAPIAADLAPSWQTSSAWMAGDNLYLRSGGATPTRVALADIENILAVEGRA